MRKRGWLGGWGMRRWRDINMGGWYNTEGNNNIPDDQKTNFQAYWTLIRGWGYDSYGFLRDFVYCSPPLTGDDAQVYRFYMQFCANGSYETEEDEDGNIAIVGFNIISISRVYGVVLCNTIGQNINASSSNSTWLQGVGANNNRYTGWTIKQDTISDGQIDYLWSLYQNQSPVLDYGVMDMMQSYQADNLRIRTINAGHGASNGFWAINSRVGLPDLYSNFPLFWYESSSTNSIVLRAMELQSYKYWYGAKGQVASITLADSLRNGQYTRSVWTQQYYNEAILDIDGITRVGDCSFLVCHAYGIQQIGSSQINRQFPIWEGQPKDGMILWRSGHVAIYSQGNAIQLRGISSDFQILPITTDIYTSVHYDPRLIYN